MFNRFYKKIIIAFSKEKALFVDIKRIFGLYPNNIELYKLAFVHRSAPIISPSGEMINNERLEYLGDAILNAIVADYLFSTYTNTKEGLLTRMRSRIVNGALLTQIARNLKLDQYIICQANVQTQGKYFYGDMMEALIGALYLDVGYNRTKKIILKRILADFLSVESLVNLEVDFKSRVIEWCQKNKYSIQFSSKTHYNSIEAIQIFHATINISNGINYKGTGKSKKEAEQDAARQIWEKEINTI